ncbi:Multidrug efflux pump subunit AcrA (membrane-fusion protein) [Poseidonocella pacifica]|uniref:Multidrug efflux pump subunit AcrA (Membrane-fusion protein) n=1 Tax=Poseidonocella pacifica TaxID=871651 RepID=A0A1I0YES8_9RHOB|nr:efflux RND transporter periplasmic adaptor subunit [Poseidonocella pacifica]SFB11266.1 Multidrug efflux pump subunit AcrA (membrane-fusion protein) [Poseidonocella pacifica]
MTRQDVPGPPELPALIRDLSAFSGAAEAFWPRFADIARGLSQAEAVVIFWRPREGEEIWRRLAASPQSAPEIALETVVKPAIMRQARREGIARGEEAGATLLLSVLQVTDEAQEVVLLARYRGAPRDTGLVMARLQALSSVPLAFDAGRKVRQASRDAARLSLTLELLGKVLDCDGFDRAALTFVNGLSEQFACESVSFVWRAREGMRLRAISHAEGLDRRTEASALVEEAAQEALTQGTEVVWPNSDRTVAQAHGRYAALVQPGHLITLPMIETSPDGKSRPLGAVVLERQSMPFTAAEQWALRMHCEMVQSPLSWLHRDTRWLPVRLGRAITPSIPRWLRPRSGAGKRLLVLALALVVGALFVPVPFNVTGTAILKTDAMAFVGAPFDGYIEDSTIILGDEVTKGTTLFTLARTELVLERSTLLAELAQANRDAEIRRSLDQLPEMRIAQAKAEEVKARLLQIDQRLASATATAPIDGVVVEGEPGKKIGEAVRRGEAVVTLAALSSLYVEAAISERDLAFLEQGQGVRLTLLARPDETFRFDVDRIIPASAVQDADNVFPIRMSAPDADNPTTEWWLPGMTGVAKVSVGNRPLGWIATRRVVDYLRLLLWF